jgi:hypothetical protein
MTSFVNSKMKLHTEADLTRHYKVHNLACRGANFTTHIPERKVNVNFIIAYTNNTRNPSCTVNATYKADNPSQCKL